ncbi:MAG TPA: sigma-70 family RNA polymerase sigma factor [Caldithrix abyssi]|uniref:RNA polymerase sigma factor n=1 Tax=Caldithrix abyssi TaxID=187145 RepID=A0A7V4TXV3_CALAY|nr:sigma-70 family RNA polymerase sigma factor [Caldithrix abyssi]
MESKKLPENSALWVDEHGDFLYRYAYLRVNSKNLAEDLVQDTFLSALKSYDSFGQRSSIRTWLVSILRNKIIDHYRKTVRRKDIEVETDPDHDFYEEGPMAGRWREDRTPGDWDLHPGEALRQNEFMRILRQCLEILPERISSVFILREIDGQNSEEICKELDISPSNLWVILHRARTQLRRCLERDWFGKKQQKDL